MPELQGAWLLRAHLKWSSCMLSSVRDNLRYQRRQDTDFICMVGLPPGGQLCDIDDFNVMEYASLVVRQNESQNLS